jgi:SAM-dependent methyltransferase
MANLPPGEEAGGKSVKLISWLESARTVSLPLAPSSSEMGDQATLLDAISARWERYRSRAIDEMILPGDDMLHGNLDHYRSVGLSALQIVTEAMLAARRVAFPTVLDLPCGGGRVTRHLAHFFPDAQLTVSDVDKSKQAFVATHFNAQQLDAPADFSTPPMGRFDLIFVGSLFTHFDELLFRRAFGWFVGALKERGILIITLHGRTVAQRSRSEDNARLRKAVARFRRGAFGFARSRRWSGLHGVPYGTSLTPPAWAMSLVQARADIALLSYKEAAWDCNQDALILQKAEVTPARGLTAP